MDAFGPYSTMPENRWPVVIQLLHQETLGKQQLILSLSNVIVQDDTVLSCKTQCNPFNETYTVSVLLQSGAHSWAALLRSFR